jgi:transcription elongation factor Elf1
MTWLRVGSSEQVPVMTEAEGDKDHRSEVVFLPTVTCPVCASNTVVVEIEIETTPILSCTACGHTSWHPD